MPAYASAKSGLGGLTKALSNEWAKHNVNVNAIAPGYIMTDMNERILGDPTRYRQISERIPAGRWGDPEDFKGVVVFLASNASTYLSGEIVTVDGVSALCILALWTLLTPCRRGGWGDEMFACVAFHFTEEEEEFEHSALMSNTLYSPVKQGSDSPD